MRLLAAASRRPRGFATAEFDKLATTAIHIETAQPPIPADHARILWDMQTNATRAALAAVEGPTLPLAEAVIIAALAVVAQAIDTAVGFALV